MQLVVENNIYLYHYLHCIKKVGYTFYRIFEISTILLDLCRYCTFALNAKCNTGNMLLYIMASEPIHFK